MRRTSPGRFLLCLSCACFCILILIGTLRGPSTTPRRPQYSSTPVAPGANADRRLNFQTASESELQTRIRKLEQREDLLYERIERLEPWERCLRFKYRRANECQEGDNPLNDKPPCVMDILAEMSVALTQALEQADITYWISYGTLLGAIRENQILRWTLDVDVVIPTEEYGSMGKKIISEGVLEAKGYRFFYDKKYPDIGRACVTEKVGPRFTKWELPEPDVRNYYNHYPYIDIYSTHEDTVKAREKGPEAPVRVKFGPQCTYNVKTIFPLKKVSLYGHQMFAPNNTTKYLTQLYGPNFMQPPDMRLRSGHGGYNDACKPEWQKL